MKRKAKSFRIDPLLIDGMKMLIKRNPLAFRNESQVIEVALSELIEKHQGNGSSPDPSKPAKVKA